MQDKRYLLITPVKNEEDNLPNLIESVVKQTVKPILWMFIDDGSIDNSNIIIDDEIKKHAWIKCIRQKESPRDIKIHVASLYNRGSLDAIGYCEANNISYDYIATLDADMIIPTNFFEEIMIKFELNHKLGIASGDIQIVNNGKLEKEWRRDNTASGGELICKKVCFEDIGGLPISCAWDSVLCAKAKLRGWNVKRFDDLNVMHTRKTSSAEGLWKGYKINGLFNYYLNYNCLYVLAKGMYLCLFKKPYYIGIAYLVGYFESLFKGVKKIDDDDVKYYFGHVKLIEMKSIYKRSIGDFIKVKIKRVLK